MTRSIDALADALSDRYAIEREVGSGGMATVYLAHDRKHERKVALKVLRPELAAAMGSDRFPREIRLVAQFNHPHILSLYDSGEAAGFLYYVMPYVEGESLRDRLTRERQLPVSDAVRILRDVADALAYSHARGVVHRDIKPANVLLSGRHAVVTDFGVAKAVTAASDDSATTVGIAVGTPQYMSPEQAMGDANIDHRADIYAMGVLAYEILAGRPPFEAGTSGAVLAAQVMEAPVDIQVLRPGLPAPLGDTIMRCLAKNPADRWQSAEEVIARLESITATPSGGVTPTDTRLLEATSVRPSGRNRTARIAGVAAVVVILVVAGIWAFGGRGAGGINTMGVMPIEDISGQDSAFVVSMHDLVTNALGRLGTAGVVPRSTMIRYAGTDMTIRDVARENDLDAVVEATVFRAGDILRINVQFTDPATSRALWSDTYERNVTDVMAAQRDVAEQIANGVRDALAAPGSKGETGQ